MDQIPKRVKRALRDLMGRAHEVELGRALTELRGQFSRWEAGQITAFDLAEAIHKFHQGPARELYNRYTSQVISAVVAYAIVDGVLDRGAIDPEVLAYLRPALSFYEAERSAQ